jgi:hypothetical protein
MPFFLLLFVAIDSMAKYIQPAGFGSRLCIHAVRTSLIRILDQPAASASSPPGTERTLNRRVGDAHKKRAAACGDCPFPDRCGSEAAAR